MIRRRLNPFNCVVILIDFQTHLLLTIGSIAPQTLIENASDLARIAKLLNIPTILTTVGTKSFGGPLIPQLQVIFPSQEPIECTTMSLWDESKVFGVVEGTGRRRLVMAGLWTDFCVALTTIQALELGYEVYVVSDACGDLSTEAQEAAIRRMVQAGATSVECRQVLAELQQDKPLRMPGIHNSVSNRKRKFPSNYIHPGKLLKTSILDR